MEIQEQLERLTGIVESLAASADHHDDQFGKLILLADKHKKEMADETDRLFQAYLKRLPLQQPPPVRAPRYLRNARGPRFPVRPSAAADCAERWSRAAMTARRAKATP